MKHKHGSHKKAHGADKPGAAGGGHAPAEGTGIERRLHTPEEDHLVPLEPLDLGRIHSVNELVTAMGRTAFTGRQVGEAADVLEAMARDQECLVVMTLAGAMTVAKQGLVITDLIAVRHGVEQCTVEVEEHGAERGERGTHACHATSV